MHGVNAELKGHNKLYKNTFYCGCPVCAGHGSYIKKITHRLERRGTKQLLHIIKQEIDTLGGQHLDYQFRNNENLWTQDMDSC